MKLDWSAMTVAAMFVSAGTVPLVLIKVDMDARRRLFDAAIAFSTLAYAMGAGFLLVWIGVLPARRGSRLAAKKLESEIAKELRATKQKD